MAGYYGRSRSNNSLEAINNFEMPLSMINRSRLDDFQRDLGHDFSQIDNRVFNLSVNVWKFAAAKSGRASWHHTSKFFNETDHYSLESIADYLTDNIDTIEDDYKKYLADKKREKEELKGTLEVGYIEYQVWGGTLSRPKLVGQEMAYGYIDRSGKKDWLIDKSGHRFDINAQKVNHFFTFDNLSDLKKAYPDKIDLRKFKKFLRSEGIID